MAEPFSHSAAYGSITSTPVHVLCTSGDRRCQISVTRSQHGEGVAIETFDRDGIKLCGTLTLSASELPSLLNGVAEAARSLGFGITGEISTIGGAALASNVVNPREL